MKLFSTVLLIHLFIVNSISAQDYKFNNTSNVFYEKGDDFGKNLKLINEVKYHVNMFRIQTLHADRLETTNKVNNALYSLLLEGDLIHDHEKKIKKLIRKFNRYFNSKENLSKTESIVYDSSNTLEIFSKKYYLLANN